MRARKLAHATAAIAVAAVTAVAGLGGIGAAAAADRKEPEAVVVGDRTFGAEHGLVIESGEVSLSRTRSNTATPMAATVYSRGSSYASTDHPTFVSYVGKAFAAANIYNGQRVIQASFKYMRDGNDVISWQRSNATSGTSCRWSAGATKSHTVYDSLNPWAAKTKFRYDFVLINSQVC